MTINTHGITGRLFRKAAFNGLPIPDEKPQAKEETDAEHEESYVDVFDLALRHSVSDVYIPLPGNELTLTVQRILSPEVWGTHPGLKPWELPNKPFGPCWDTNLCPHIRFGFLVTDSKSEPDWMDVIDENGTSYRFVLIWRREEPPTPGSPPPPPRPFFLPMPSNRTEQDNYLCSLEVVSGAGDVDPDDVIASMPQWTFRFRRKFGTTLHYENTAVSRSYRTSPLPPPVPEPGEPPPVDPVQYYFYARLTKVEDRFGNELRYELDAVGNSPTDWLREGGLISGLPLTLLPSRIVSTNVTPATVPERTITIRSERVPLPPTSSGISAASVRRVLKVYPPRAHASSGEMLEEHATLYTYSPVDPTFYDDPVVLKPSVPPAIKATPILFRPLTKVLRPEGMLTDYEWITEIEEDTNPADPADPTQYFFHTNLGALRDSAGIGYRFHYLFNQFQQAYSDNPKLEPQGWYNKAGLRAFVRIIAGPESTSFWSPLRDDALGRINTNGVPPELLLPENSGYNFDVEPVFRAVIDGEGYVRRWVFDEHVIYQADEIQRLLFPSEEQQRNLEWLVLWTRVTVIHPLPDPDHPLLNITESATYNALAGLATRTLLDFCGSLTEWEHTDAWDIAQVHGLEWLATAAPAGWFFKFYPDPTAQINALSYRREFTYYSTDPNLGASRIMIRVKDEEDRITAYEIDPATGNRTSEKVWTAPTGTPPAPQLVRHTVFDYHPVFRSFLTSRTTKNGLILPDGSTPDMVETFTPDAWGYTHREVRGAEDTAGQFSRAIHEHDENGNRTRTTDGAGNRTDFHYDTANRLDAVAFFGTGTVQLAARTLDYDARGNKVAETDENGSRTEFVYDGENRIKHLRKVIGSDPLTMDPLYLETSYLYNRVGSRTQTIDPNGNVSRTFYDAIQRPTDSLVWKERALTPPFSTPLETQKLHAFVTSFEYDIHHFCGSTAFDTSGFKPTTIIHPKVLAGPSGPTFARSHFTYDALYRSVLEKHEYEADLYAETTRIYNPTGTVWKETDPAGMLTTLTYDAENRPLTTTITNSTYPGDTATVSKSYTPAGLEKDSTNERGAISAIRYDLAGRAARAIAPDPVTGTLTANSPVTQSLYDPAGNLLKNTNPLGHVWDYEYDYRNRRTVERLPAAIDAGTTGFPTVRAELVTVYDPAGNVTEKHDARGNITLTEYDPANRPWRITAPPRRRLWHRPPPVCHYHQRTRQKRQHPLRHRPRRQRHRQRIRRPQPSDKDHRLPRPRPDHRQHLCLRRGQQPHLRHRRRRPRDPLHLRRAQPPHRHHLRPRHPPPHHHHGDMGPAAQALPHRVPRPSQPAHHHLPLRLPPPS
jgi:YD repeat-containing protein